MCVASEQHFRKTLLVILGPTASGKTALAIRLARHFRTEIISADSRQFYKELKIGSAAPSDKELQAVPHHFIGFLSVKDYYNVSRYETDALNKLQELFRFHHIVLMCGGSGLYIHAVCKGMDDLPEPDAEIREQLKNELKQNGIELLQKKLKLLDPDYYHQADLKNHTRLIRALEICILTGKPYSTLRTGKPQPRNFNIIKIGLNLPKDELMAKITERTDRMLSDGLENEARMLYPWRHHNALKTVGYAELFEYFDGKISFETAKEKIITNTWRYAKRQMTWFRKDPEIQWFHPNDVEKITDFITRNLSE